MSQVVIITGVQGAGKSSVAAALASVLERSIHLDGDLIYRMVVSGRENMSPSPSGEAVRQLRLRYAAAVEVLRIYATAGFSTVYSDVIRQEDYPAIIHGLSPLSVCTVVLTPSTDVVVAREISRGKNSYRDWMRTGLSLSESIDMLYGDLPVGGIRIDSSNLTLEATVDAIRAFL
jgi:chloramphenicol 3-O-phosphotransferase